MCYRHRRRSDWNSGGTHGGTYYKSPAVEAKKHIFLHCNASNLVLEILQHDKIWVHNPPAPNSGALHVLILCFPCESLYFLKFSFYLIVCLHETMYMHANLRRKLTLCTC